MAAEDWAIVVGINHYPGISEGNLQGPVADAAAFSEWLQSAQGGDVPNDHITLIQSVDLSPVPLAEDAKPAIGQIHQAFSRLLDLSNTNRAAKKGQRVGRRLYVYYAGHGFEPAPEQAVLLLANAVEKSILYHVPGRSYPDYFYRAGVFDELVLFMDCCRESYPKVPIMEPPLVPITGPNPGNGFRFYGFGTKWSRNSWEKPIPQPDGPVHGVFTTALLDGLRGCAQESNGGTSRITAQSLASWLYNGMKMYLSEEEQRDPEIANEPYVFVDPAPGDAFVLVSGTAPVLDQVFVEFDEDLKGHTLQILDGMLNTVASSVAVPPGWQVQLKRGLYQAKSDNGRGQMFEVPGGSAIHVKL